MSDAGRKDWSTKAKEELTPDSAKSTQQKMKEGATDIGDRFARGAQPDDQKSGMQETFDKGQRMHDNKNHGGTGESILDKAKNAMGLGDH
ncbi:heat shock protein 9/12-domain-containing protein [Aspergillus caelatus]|uniref:Heat shock protein 9/12-domain-containing protein n=1 Tax=Aspergillus caelatus TaxID=61420 RepID=A0A5N7A805_9EURO|nr:heat shock protein 9/12-domain-containing protein [Aspergillus caelatus]KAE8365346.1 heat shock protein 9/12-domain-containing protein [Aspergillus caelatus]